MATKIGNVQFRSYDTLVEGRNTHMASSHDHHSYIHTFNYLTTNSVLVIEGVRVYGFITDRAALSASNCAKEQEKHDKLLNQQTIIMES